MKKNLRIIYISLFVAFCGCFLSACIDPIQPPVPQETAGGEGTFSLEIGDEPVARTILPTTVQSSFLAYTLVFSSTGRDNVSADRTSSTLSNPVTLSAVTWTLTVTAYTDTARTKPAARGSLDNIEITAGANVSRSLELKPIIESGATGTFSWNISYPAEVTVASMKITPLNAASGTPEQTLYLRGGTPSASSPLTLNTGYYQVVFSLTNGQHSTGRTEYLHVYKNMDSRFEYAFTQAHFTILSVTNGNDSGLGSLRYAITNAAANNTILIESGVGTILLTSQISITKSFVLDGNGVKIQASTSTSASTPVLYFNSGTEVTIRRVRFSDTQVMVISNYGTLNLESCIFSNNAMGTGAYSIRNAGTMSIKGSTFYKNSGDTSGVINMQSGSTTLTLAGNLFYGNTNNGNTRPIVAPNYGTVISNGYNVVDVPLGTYSGNSGWTGASTDKVISSQPIVETTFKLIPGRGAQNVIVSRPGAYPTADFYGNPIPTVNAAAGAVQALVSGYTIDLSVNNSVLGSAVITSAPQLNADGLYNGGSVTVTANSKGVPGYSFQYWQVNNTTYTANPLTFTLTDHSKVQAVFGRAAPASVRRVLFSGPTETVTLNGLSNNDIYLVKINTSEFIVNNVDTGGSSNSFPISTPDFKNDVPAPDMQLPRMGHPAADEFNANPPPIADLGPRRSRAVFVAPVVGNTRMFWVESYYNSGIWVQKQATLRATGTHGNIWVMDDNYTSGTGSGNNISTAQAQALATKFDSIYPIETSLLGYEYGGGPGGDGGKDEDPKIQILVYGILNASGGSSGAAGFFWSKDYYEQPQLTSQKTNLAEIFYLDASCINSSQDYMYSTLVHEFQHMIHFNVKNVKNGKTSESWYNEMLSELAEDVISPLIGIAPTNGNHAINVRIPTFLTSYYQLGITEWSTLDSMAYAKGYAFGAYLLRNYGGAGLLQEMLANNSTNVESITSALGTVAGNGLSFEEALRRFGEAMIYSGTMPSDVQSFDKTVTKTINGNTYTATKFNIWTGFGSTKPKIFGLNEQVEIRPYSLTVHQDASEWTGQSGNKSITLKRPNDANVEFYLMVK